MEAVRISLGDLRASESGKRVRGESTVVSKDSNRGKRRGRTGVQLQFSEDWLKCSLLYGNMDELSSNHAGSVAWFVSGQVVAYLIEVGRKQHVFVFRTLDKSEKDEVKIGGVSKRVRLLVDVQRVGSIRWLSQLFVRLQQGQPPPSDLSDGFYVRVNQVLNGRRVGEAIEGLLRHEKRS